MFKLLIESSKDITSLSINFADGSVQTVESNHSEDSTTLENQEIPDTKHINKNIHNKDSFINARDELLDLSANFGTYNPGSIQKPEIQEVNRVVNVADELQNLDI